jgi:type IV secretion system protein VirB10
MRLLLTVIVLSAAALAQQPGELRDAKPAQPAQQKAEQEQLEQPGLLVIPAGTEIPLKLAQAITTKNAKIGDPVYAETAFPYTVNDRVVIPAGTYVQGRITEVRRPGRVKGRAEMLMHFTSMIYRNGYTVMLPGGVENMPGAEQQDVKDKEGTIRQGGNKTEDIKTVGKVAAAGAGVGGIAGRNIKGVGIGGAAGAAAGLGWVLLTRGPDMTLPVGTSVQMVIQRSMTVKASKID